MLCKLMGLIKTSVIFISFFMTNWSAQAVEQFELKNSVGKPMLVERYGNGPTAVILAHQRDGSLEDWQFYAQELEELGHSAYVFDFNGHGKKKGFSKKLNTQHKDIALILEYVRNTAPSKIYLLGSSMGAASVIKASEAEKLNGTIALAPYANLSSKWTSSSTKSSKKITNPVLLVSTKGDSSAKHAKTLNNSIAQSELIMYGGKAHGIEIFETPDGDDLRQRIEQFLQN